MPRIAGIVAPGLAHHVTQRGNNHQDVLFVDGDRRTYLALLKDRCDAGLRVLGYCLMTSHVHLIVVPPDEESLADEETAAPRGHLCAGRPLATDSFLAKQETRLGRRLRPRPVGRPRQGEKWVAVPNFAVGCPQFRSGNLCGLKVGTGYPARLHNCLTRLQAYDPLPAA
jgi:putative transposase